MIDGILNVYKEKGYTSFDVVAKLRGILKQKKIGHTGTLDPMAEGVLPICLGKATKLSGMLLESDKQYEAVMLLGYDTDTEDVMGKVLAVGASDYPDREITSVIESFVGEYEQLPPMYSAIKIGGKKLYEYARAGEAVERTPRHVEIYSIDDISIYELDASAADLGSEFVIPNDGSYKCISMMVHCSKGTYIRSLCRDIGKKLGSYGTLMALKRKEAHGNKIEDAITLDTIKALYDKGGLMQYIMPIDSLLLDYVRADIREEFKNSLLNGNQLSDTFFEKSDTDREHAVRVYYDGTLYGLYQYEKGTGMFKPVKMFL
ncbi:MAG: tRNA pseudouridine(55) synthase TruB [Clostridium sp.]|nr:tRNA pseudouridine(55) synthase TruB [Clostridium sp.]